jgi:hypothetical protein
MRAKYGQEGFRRLLERYRMTEEDFRRRVRELELVRLMRSEVERSVRVSEDEVRRYYREHLKEYTEPRRARVRILVFGDREAAQRARRDLEAGRRTFQDLAPFHRLGTDPQAFHEVVAGRDPDLEPLVFGAAPGRVQGPVKVGALWVVFRVEQVFPGAPAALRTGPPAGGGRGLAAEGPGDPGGAGAAPPAGARGSGSTGPTPPLRREARTSRRQAGRKKPRRRQDRRLRVHLPVRAEVLHPESVELLGAHLGGVFPRTPRPW